MSASDHIGQQLGQYRLLRLLGQGGMGSVYLAEDTLFGQAVAVKVLHTQLASYEDQRAFVKEAHSIALNHHHIVQILGYGTMNGLSYIVMPYAQSSLRKRYPEGTQVPLSVVISYVKQIADALQYVHDHNIIHQDVKPDNILLGSNNEVLLSDFGIAISASTALHSTQGIEGTVTYMAPERWNGKVSKASDQYSLAVTVYEWLSGDPPFVGNRNQIMYHHIVSSPPPLQDKDSAITPEIEEVVLKALAKDPHQRYPSIQAFAIALEQASQTAGEHLPSTIQSIEDQEKQVTLNADVSTPISQVPINQLPSEYQTEPTIPRIQDTPLFSLSILASFHSIVGKLFSIFGFNEEALRHYDNAISLVSLSPQLYVSRGKVFFHLKRYQEALGAYDEAIRLAPQLSKAYRERGKTYEQLGQQSYDELKQLAQQSYKKARELGIE